MALKITLKPDERIIIGGTAITNGGPAATLLVENKVPILREKHILRKENADSPARRIYFAVQLMYVDQDNLARYHKLYWNLVRGFIKAAPSALGLIGDLSREILAGRYYQALKLARKIIEYEQLILSRQKTRQRAAVP